MGLEAGRNMGHLDIRERCKIWGEEEVLKRGASRKGPSFRVKELGCLGGTLEETRCMLAGTQDSPVAVSPHVT